MKGTGIFTCSTKKKIFVKISAYLSRQWKMLNVVSVLFLLPGLKELHGEVDPSQISALYR